MRAVVLVGGFGTRLRPLTLTRPKQMLPIAGRPMLEHVVDHLAGHGVTEVILSLGYKPDAFAAAYPDTCRGVPLRFVVEEEPLGTGGAIRYAATEAGIDDTFLVLNGDVLTDLDVTALVAGHRTSGARGTLNLTRVDDPSRFGVVVTDAEGRVESFVEKPPPGEAPSDLINAGTYVLEPDVLDAIPEGRQVSVERETFPELVAVGALRATAWDGYWLDCGTPEAFVAANLDLLSGRRAGGLVDAATGGVVSPGAEVSLSVVPVGATVGAGARVVDSVLYSGAIVADGAVVERSVIGEDATVGEGARVTELSVIGDRELVEAGEVLVGARRPEPAE